MRQSGDVLAWLNEFAGIVLLAAGVISFVLLLWLKPLLSRYALAKPNVRSSHKSPTPQGGGIAVIAATIVVYATIAVFFPAHINESWRLAVVIVSVIGLAVVGIIDDIHPIAALPRLLLQAIAVVAVVASLPDDLRVLVVVPWWLERALIVRCGALVCEPRQFHGRHRLDDSSGGGATLGRSQPVRFDGRPSRACHPGSSCPLRRYAWLCALQPPGCTAVSRRRRKLTDRLVVGLVADFAGGQRTSCRSIDIAALLPGRYDHYSPVSAYQPRAGTAGTPQPLLPTGNRWKV